MPACSGSPTPPAAWSHTVFSAAGKPGALAERQSGIPLIWNRVTPDLLPAARLTPTNDAAVTPLSLLSSGQSTLQSRRSTLMPGASVGSIGAMVANASVVARTRSEEHTSELQSLMRSSYAVFCLKKKTPGDNIKTHNNKY